MAWRRRPVVASVAAGFGAGGGAARRLGTAARGGRGRLGTFCYRRGVGFARRRHRALEPRAIGCRTVGGGGRGIGHLDREAGDARGFSLGGDGRGEVGRVGAGHRSRRRRARLDLRERLGRFEERALHDSVGIEQTVATGAQLLELTGQQLSPLGEIVDDAFAQAPGLFDHREALFTRTVELGTRLALDARPEVGGVVVGGGAHLDRALVGDPHEIGGPLLGFLEHPVRNRLGLGRPLPQHLFRVVAQALGFLVGLVNQAGRAFLGLGADVGCGLAGRSQQPGRLLAERVEQRLLVERLGRAEPGLELVDRAQQLLLTTSPRRAPRRPA